ncbi:AAA family ATPase [Occallatibacter savannae]|uniref:AAA family ATPase n=1 Tax=Occallatibacter savannae TaxID=1002691 RepID=UPI000D68923E|nr:AAA family ATPase [Occallatibacter savannae]
MIHTLAVSGYRSLRELVLPLGQLNLVTGANGTGKSSLYRALRLLGDAALNTVVSALAHEGGLHSTLWAGPETIAKSVRRGEHPVEGTPRQNAVSLKLGFSGDPYGYCIDLGYPPPGQLAFPLDPAIKRECIWHGGVYRRAAVLVDRNNRLVQTAPAKIAKHEEPEYLTKELSSTDSMLATIADPQRAPEMLAVREAIRGWRFYEGFRTDTASPVRVPQVGTFTPVLNNDGTDLPAALETIRLFGAREELDRTIDDAFPGSRVVVDQQAGRFEVQLRQHGLLRPLAAAELSDGTLRYLLWTAALLTPRPPELMVLNEPETSLHPDLLPALARLIAHAAERTQLIVVSHSPRLIEALGQNPRCNRLHLEKSFGETVLAGATLFNTPKWEWPKR